MTDDINIIIPLFGFTIGLVCVFAYVLLLRLATLRDDLNRRTLEITESLDTWVRVDFRSELALAARIVTTPKVRELEQRVTALSILVDFLKAQAERREYEDRRGSTLTPDEMVNLIHAFNPPIPDPVDEPDAYIEEQADPPDYSDGIFDPAVEALAGNWIVPEMGATDAHLPTIDDPFPALHPDEARAAAEMAQHENDMQMLADGALGFPTGLDG